MDEPRPLPDSEHAKERRRNERLLKAASWLVAVMALLAALLLALLALLD